MKNRVLIIFYNLWPHFLKFSIPKMPIELPPSRQNNTTLNILGNVFHGVGNIFSQVSQTVAPTPAPTLDILHNVFAGVGNVFANVQNSPNTGELRTNGELQAEDNSPNSGDLRGAGDNSLNNGNLRGTDTLGGDQLILDRSLNNDDLGGAGTLGGDHSLIIVDLRGTGILGSDQLVSDQSLNNGDLRRTVALGEDHPQITTDQISTIARYGDTSLNNCNLGGSGDLGGDQLLNSGNLRGEHSLINSAAACNSSTLKENEAGHDWEML